jgi:Hydroxymethylglutaryl-CoA reductase
MMKIDEVVEKLIKGEISFHEIDNLLEANAAMVARRLALEKILGIGLPSIGSTVIDYSEIKIKCRKCYWSSSNTTRYSWTD